MGVKLTWTEAKELYRASSKGNIYVNDTYQVTHHVGKEVDYIWDESLQGKMDYLSIKRRDREKVRSWSDFQQIKNLICKDGENRFAVEIYPPEIFLLNTSNQYHLWVYPSYYDIGIGFREPKVITESGKSTISINGEKFETKQG